MEAHSHSPAISRMDSAFPYQILYDRYYTSQELRDENGGKHIIPVGQTIHLGSIPKIGGQHPTHLDIEQCIWQIGHSQATETGRATGSNATATYPPNSSQEEPHDRHYHDVVPSHLVMGSIPQELYEGGAVSIAPLSRPIQFEWLDLHRTLSDRMYEVSGHNHPAFSSHVELRCKMSVRFLVTGHDSYTYQANILRSNSKRPTRGQLIIIIAKELRKFIDREKKAGKPLIHGGHEVDLNELAILHVLHVSRGSLQAVIGAMCSN